jgi:hypothetical protein
MQNSMKSQTRVTTNARNEKKVAKKKQLLLLFLADIIECHIERRMTVHAIQRVIFSVVVFYDAKHRVRE